MNLCACFSSIFGNLKSSSVQVGGFRHYRTDAAYIVPAYWNDEWIQEKTQKMNEEMFLLPALPQQLESTCTNDSFRWCVFLSVRFLGKSNTVSQRYKSNVPQKIIIVMGEISIRAFCDRIRHVNRHFLIGRIQSIWCDYGSTNTHKHEEKSGFNTFQWGCRWCNLYHKI